MPSTTLTVRLPEELKDKLAELSEHTSRTRSYLAAEAIASYVEKELAIVQGIESGLEDMRAGRVVAHDDVVADVAEIIAESKKPLKKP